MNQARYSFEGHRYCEFASPVFRDKAERLVAALNLSSEKRALDVGCGFGGWAPVVAATGAQYVGIDRNHLVLGRAWSRPAMTNVAFLEADARTAELESYDAILCVGSTHALGGLEETLAFAQRHLNPGGRLLVGEGIWLGEPSDGYLSTTQMEKGAYRSFANTADQCAAAGYRVAYAAMSSQDEWDHYEGLYRRGILDWCAAHRDDPDTPAYLELSDSWYGNYLRLGRETLGFGFYVLETTPAAS